MGNTEKKKHKLKTNKVTAKSFRVIGSEITMRTKGQQSHLKRRKSKRPRRQMQRMHEVASSGVKRNIKRLAPY